MPVCIVKNCFSGSKQKGLYCDPKVHLHRFPKDVEMRALWVKQIQRTANVNKEINCDTDAVCSLHFSLNSYEERTIVQNMLDYSPKCGRKLKPTAIPFSDGNQSSPIKTPAGLFSVTNSADESNSVEPAFSRKIPCQINLFGVSDTIPGVKCLENNEPDLFQKSKFENIIRMQNEKIEYYKNYVNLENQRFESRFSDILSKFFTSTQINQILHPSTKVSKWLPEDISSAITLRSISPKAYRYLRNKKQYPLPGLSTLRRWASTFEVDPGILESVLTLMKSKGSSIEGTYQPIP